MIFVKQYKNLIISIIIALYILMLNLSIFHFSDISMDNHNINPLNSMVNFPKPSHLEFLSMNAILPEKEISTISYFVKERFPYFQKNLYITDYSNIFSYHRVKMFVYKLMVTYNNFQNTSISNAIPLGGHAPPVIE